MHRRFAFGLLTLTAILSGCSAPDSTTQRPPATTTKIVTDIEAQTEAPLIGEDNPNAIAGQYIVVLSEGTMPNMNAQSVSQQGSSLISALGLNPQGIHIQNVYSQALSGFSATLSAQNLQKLRADQRVKYIEVDQVMAANATQSGATWGLDRIDQRNLPLNGTYIYGNTGSSVTAFILDTGINTSHVSFGGRAVWGTNMTGDGQNRDCGGHGTHVAGTVGSSTWGVAKGVKLVAVKVLGCDGYGSNSGIIAGMDWVLRYGTGRKVVNMSLGPQTRSVSQTFDDAVARLSANNVPVVLAAGNSNDDACYYSPARAPSGITVGSTTSGDVRSSFSNYGSCLSLFAPGSNITSASYASTTGSATMSGTSMAAPHVAGAVALILDANPTYTTAQVTSALLSSSTANVVSSVAGSPNRLLYVNPNSSTSPTPTPTPTPGTITYTDYAYSGYSYAEPSASGFSYSGGTMKAVLNGPSGTDFDLLLQKYNGYSWVTVATSNGSSSYESIVYSASSGTYRWAVTAYSGSGTYTLTVTQ